MPRSDGYSPAQLLFGRRQLTNLPMLQKQYEQCDFSSAKEAKDSNFLKSAEQYNADKVDMSLLLPDQPVVIQHPKTGKWDSTGFIVEIRPDKLSYTVKCEGRTFIRSRKMLRANNFDKQTEVNVIASLDRSTSTVSASKCVNPKTPLPDPLRTLDRHRQTTTGLSTNLPELHSCSSIGPLSAPGFLRSSLSSFCSSSSTSATGETREPTRRQGGQSSMNSLCSRLATSRAAWRWAKIQGGTEETNDIFWPLEVKILIKKV